MANLILERVEPVMPAPTQVFRVLKRAVGRYVAPTDPAAWTRKAATLRRRALADVYLKGWPRTVVNAEPRVVWGEVLRPHPAYVIRKLRYEIYPGYWVPALLYEPTKLTGRVGVALNPNGHHVGGKAVDYKQARCINLARRGLIALNFEFIGMGELGGDLTHNDLSALDVTGMASVGFFYLAMSKGLDVLLAHRHADPKRVAVTGLSGGGWQTIVISALDERVTLSVPVAGYTSLLVRGMRLADIGDVEQLPPDMMTVVDYTDLTAMLAPGPCLQIFNEQDTCCFRPDLSKAAIHDAVRPTYKAHGAEDAFEYYINVDPGTHNYEADNRNQLYRFLAKHFRLDTRCVDLHHEDELLPEAALNVGLPAEQITIRSLARARARRLSAGLPLPRTARQRDSLRKKLAALIRLPATRGRSRCVGGRGKTSHYHVTVGPWTIPAAAIKKSDDRVATLLIADTPSEAESSADSAAEGTAVLADLVGHGAARCDPKYLMMAQAVGERVLGIHAAQVLAAAGLARRVARSRRVRLVGLGPRSALVALVAAALKPDLFERLTVTGSVVSLCHFFDRGANYEQLQPLFCPDLLTLVDVPQLLALAEDVPYLTPDRCVPDPMSR